MKIELEQVEPAEIESRSMEIIESELPHEIDPKLAPIIKRAVLQKMWLIRHWKQLKTVLAL